MYLKCKIDKFEYVYYLLTRLIVQQAESIYFALFD